MSGHPHKGKRSEWAICSALPPCTGEWELRPILAPWRIQRAHLMSNGGWIQIFKKQHWKITFDPKGWEWRGLAEKPE